MLNIDVEQTTTTTQSRESTLFLPDADFTSFKSSYEEGVALHGDGLSFEEALIELLDLQRISISREQEEEGFAQEEEDVVSKETEAYYGAQTEEIGLEEFAFFTCRLISNRCVGVYREVLHDCRDVPSEEWADAISTSLDDAFFTLASEEFEAKGDEKSKYDFESLTNGIGQYLTIYKLIEKNYKQSQIEKVPYVDLVELYANRMSHAYVTLFRFMLEVKSEYCTIDPADLDQIESIFGVEELHDRALEIESVLIEKLSKKS